MILRFLFYTDMVTWAQRGPLLPGNRPMFDPVVSPEVDQDESTTKEEPITELRELPERK